VPDFLVAGEFSVRSVGAPGIFHVHAEAVRRQQSGFRLQEYGASIGRVNVTAGCEQSRKYDQAENEDRSRLLVQQVAPWERR